MSNAFVEPDFNPYAPPGTAPSGDELTDSYKIVWGRLTFAECWRLATGPLWPVVFFVLALRKILRSRRLFRVAIPYPRQIEVIAEHEIPERANELWRASIEEGRDRGLQPIFIYRLASAGMTRDNLAAILSSDDGLVQVGLSYQAFEINKVLKEKVTITAGSLLDDGRRVATRNTSAYLDHPPEYMIRVASRRPLGIVLDRHLGWIASQGWMPVVRPSTEIAERVLEREQAIVDFQIARGVLAPMTRREVSRLQDATDRLGSRPAVIQSRPLAFLQAVELLLSLAVVFAALCMVIQSGVVAGAGRVSDRLFLVVLGFFPAIITLRAIRQLLVIWSRRSAQTTGIQDRPEPRS